MNLKEAVSFLAKEDGKGIRRKSWPRHRRTIRNYVEILGGEISLADILANDWEVEE